MKEHELKARMSWNLEESMIARAARETDYSIEVRRRIM